MAEATVKGATWTNLTHEELLLVVKAAIDHAGHSTTLSIGRPYEGFVGRSTWEVEVEGIGLDVVQGIDGELREHLAAQPVRSPFGMTARDGTPVRQAVVSDRMHLVRRHRESTGGDWHQAGRDLQSFDDRHHVTPAEVDASWQWATEEQERQRG